MKQMELPKPKEYQTLRLFAILGLLTLMTVVVMKVVLFAPPDAEMSRGPAEISGLPNLQTTPNNFFRVVPAQNK